MNDLKSDLSHWVNVNAVIMGSQQNIELQLLLRDGSMTYPFLSIIDEEKNFCLIPVTRLIEVLISPTKAIFSFSEYKDIKLQFLFTETRNYELFLSQFRLTAQISRNTFDEFHDENLAFLEKIVPTDPLPIPYDILSDLFETKCCLSPIPYSKEVENVWKERTTLLNTSYFTETMPINLNICTWNVSSELPTPFAMNEIQKCAFGCPDISFFSFQEIDMSTKSVVTGASNKAGEWKDIIQRVLNSTDLEIVENVSLGGTFGLLALNKKNTQIRFVNSKAIRIGAHGLAANKSFILFNIVAGFANITLCACHLSAHEENVEERNQQLIKIQKSIPKNTDYLFICGDLNYRITLTYDECVPLAVNNELSKLLEKDQLTNMIMSMEELKDLKEGPITFKPTYKFDKNSDIYDTSQKRTPSYTDRVLIRTFPPRLTTGLVDSFCFETDCIHHFADERIKFKTPSYFSPVEPTPNYPTEPENIIYTCGTSKISDHKSVHSQWKLMIPGTNEDRKKEFEKLMDQKLDELISQEEPSGIATPSKVVLSVKQKQEILLENTSLAWVNWDAQSLSESISVNPKGGILIPGIPVKLEIEAKEYVEGQQFILFMCDRGTLCSLEVEVTKPTLFESLFKKK